MEELSQTLNSLFFYRCMTTNCTSYSDLKSIEDNLKIIRSSLNKLSALAICQIDGTIVNYNVSFAQMLGVSRCINGESVQSIFLSSEINKLMISEADYPFCASLTYLNKIGLMDFVKKFNSMNQDQSHEQSLDQIQKSQPELIKSLIKIMRVTFRKIEINFYEQFNQELLVVELMTDFTETNAYNFQSKEFIKYITTKQ